MTVERDPISPDAMRWSPDEYRPTDEAGKAGGAKLGTIDMAAFVQSFAPVVRAHNDALLRLVEVFTPVLGWWREEGDD